LHVLEQEVREDAGVVDQDVQPPEGLDRGRDETVDGLLDRDVPADRDDGRAGGGEPLAGGLEPVGANVSEDDTGARLGEPPRAGVAEALRRAGDERRPSPQVDERGERLGGFVNGDATTL
jgi:hypothetical protein